MFGNKHEIIFMTKQNKKLIGFYLFLELLKKLLKLRGAMVDNTRQYRASQIATFMGPTWGPPGSCRPQMGPDVGPMNLAIRVDFYCHTVTIVIAAVVIASEWGGVGGSLLSLWQSAIIMTVKRRGRDAMFGNMLHYIVGLLLSLYWPYRGIADPCFIRILVTYLRQFWSPAQT